MLSTTVIPKINAVQAGEITINAITGLDQVLTMAVKFAYCNVESGDRYGYGNQNQWSPDTITKLRELLEAIEGDILKSVFGEAASSSGALVQVDTTDGVPGL
jgi:hypothetical protein